MYMAPEVITSSRYDERADIYSFGIVMVDVMLDGRIKRLFRDKTKHPLGSEVCIAYWTSEAFKIVASCLHSTSFRCELALFVPPFLSLSFASSLKAGGSRFPSSSGLRYLSL